jgi:hypothetical protein
MSDLLSRESTRQTGLEAPGKRSEVEAMTSTPPRKRNLTKPMAIIGFVAGVITIVMVVRYFF